MKIELDENIFNLLEAEKLKEITKKIAITNTIKEFELIKDKINNASLEGHYCIEHKIAKAIDVQTFDIIEQRLRKLGYKVKHEIYPYEKITIEWF